MARAGEPRVEGGQVGRAGRQGWLYSELLEDTRVGAALQTLQESAQPSGGTLVYTESRASRAAGTAGCQSTSLGPRSPLITQFLLPAVRLLPHHSSALERDASRRTSGGRAPPPV